MAETATMNSSEWGSMTAEQREAEIDSGFAEMAASRAADTALLQQDTETTTTADDDTQVDDSDTTVVADATTTNTTAGSDATPAADDAAAGASPAAKAAGDASWLTPEDRDTATAYGLDGDFLAALPTRDVFDRVLMAIDRKAFEAGKGPQQVADAVGATNADKQPETATAAASPGDPFADLAPFKMDENAVDDVAAKPFNSFVETAAATIRQMQAEIAGLRQIDGQRAFNELRDTALTALHSLGNTELFGKPGETPTKEQAANIDKALDAHFTHAQGLLATGRQAAPTPQFLKAAVHLAFGDQLTQQQQRQLTERLKKQSRQRMGGGASKPLPPAARTANIQDDPEIDELFNNLVAERSGK